MKLLEIFQTIINEVGDTFRTLKWKPLDSTTEYATFSSDTQTFAVYISTIDLHKFTLPDILEQYRTLTVLNVVFGVVNTEGSPEFALTKQNKPFLPISIVKNAILQKSAETKADIVIFAAKSQYDSPDDFEKRSGLYSTLVLAYAKQGSFTFKQYHDSSGTYFVLIKSTLFHKLTNEQQQAIQHQIVEKITVKDRLRQIMSKIK